MNKTEIKDLFDSFCRTRVLVIGDIMLDSYYHGKVERISPEAPVPVVTVHHKEHRLGGAANVALNLKALEADVVLCGITGEDSESEIMRNLLAQNQLSHHGIISVPDRKTTVKTRIIGNKHQVLRIDHEDVDDIKTETENLLLDFVASQIHSCDVVVMEDYNKGMLTQKVIRKTLEISKNANKPVVVDPKLNHFFDYQGVALFKPNRKEVIEGLKTDLDLQKLDNVKWAIHELCTRLNCGQVMITLSEHGVMVGNKNESLHIPAHERKIADVSGAGDTVISVAALCIAQATSAEVMANLANLSGGLVCEKPGVVPIDRKQLQTEFEAIYS